MKKYKIRLEKETETVIETETEVRRIPSYVFHENGAYFLYQILLGGILVYRWSGSAIQIP